MFLKSLLISTPTKVIREIPFHKGLNLIVDETPSGETLTGNNVGKTTVLRLIDFCLGRDGSVVFKDPESKREVYQLVKDYLIDNKIIITLTHVDDLDNPQRQIEVSRNFLPRMVLTIMKQAKKLVFFKNVSNGRTGNLFYVKNKRKILVYPWALDEDGRMVVLKKNPFDNWNYPEEKEPLTDDEIKQAREELIRYSDKSLVKILFNDPFEQDKAKPEP